MKTQPPIRLGILGAALIAPKAIVEPASVNPDVVVTAIAARDPERARKFAARHDIPKAHPTYAAVIDDPDLDAIYIPLPNALHAEWVTRALESGKHVLCEKPLTSNADEAESLAELAEASGLVLCEAFHYRYHPLAIRMKEVVDGGEIGALQHVDVQLCIPLARPGDIRYSYNLAGGATMDLGCYAINIIRFLADSEPTVASARAGLALPQIDRWMRADFTFDKGVAAAMFCSLFSTCLLKLNVTVTGEAGEMSVFNILQPHLLFHRLTIKTSREKTVESFPKKSTYAYQLAAFVKAVRGEEGIATDAQDAIRNMRVIDAVYEAAGLKRRGT